MNTGRFEQVRRQIERLFTDAEAYICQSNCYVWGLEDRVRELEERLKGDDQELCAENVVREVVRHLVQADV